MVGAGCPHAHDAHRDTPWTVEINQRTRREDPRKLEPTLPSHPARNLDRWDAARYETIAFQVEAKDPGGPVTIKNTDSSPCRHLVSSTGTGIRGVSAAALWTHMHLSPVLASSAAIFLRRAPLWLHDSIAQRVCIVQEHKTTRSVLGLGHFSSRARLESTLLCSSSVLRRGWNLLGRLSSSCCCVNKPNFPMYELAGLVEDPDLP